MEWVAAGTRQPPSRRWISLREKGQQFEAPLPQGSGRTDSGVHALMQVASFSLEAPVPPANLLRAAERGFVEVLARSPKCRFKDCRHTEEPGCAVRTAVVAGEIAARRYESYRRLFRLYEKLASRT